MIPGTRIICKISKPSCRNIPKVISLLRPTVLSTPMAAVRNRTDCRRRMAVCLATGKHWARVMTLSGPPPQRCGARHCWRRVSSGWVKKIGQDLDLWARLARNNPCVAYASCVCVDYNRGAEANARTRVKVAHAKAFMQDLEEELKNPNHSKAEIAAIQRKYDLKMTVYIYTSLIAGQKHQAKQALSSWKGRPNLRNVLLRAGLWCAALLPVPASMRPSTGHGWLCFEIA